MIISRLALLLLLYPSGVEHHYQKDMQLVQVNSEPGIIELRANDPRPLYQMTMFMDRNVGWLLDYEDPPYLFRSELTGSVTKEWLASGGKEYFIPAGGVFTFRTKQDALDAGGARADELLRSLVTAYNRTANPGVFELVPQAQQRYSFAGVATKDDKGFAHGFMPVFNYSVSLPSSKQPVLSAFQSVVSQVSSLSGHQIKVGGLPTTLFQTVMYTPLSGPHPARETLANLLDATHIAISWCLLYDPNDSSYTLNLVGVGSYQKTSSGSELFVYGKR